MRLINKFIIVVIFSTLALFNTFAQEVDEKSEKSISAKQLVVMIDGRFPTSGALSSGAGIVVGRKGGLVYIATARHVVEDLSEYATDLKVQFSDKPGIEVDAFILQSEFDKGLDLALIGVQETLVPETIKDEKELPVARLDTLVGDDESVLMIGQPAGIQWKLSPKATEILQSGITELKIASKDAESGYSGGAALDENFRIVGLIISTNGTQVSIIPLPLLKEQIVNGSLPFDLIATNKTLELASSKDEAKKKLKRLGYTVDSEGYIRALGDESINAIVAFEELNPSLDLGKILFELSNLPDERWKTVSARISESGVEVVSQWKIAVRNLFEAYSTQGSFSRWSLDYSSECRELKDGVIGELFSGISCDNDYGSLSYFTGRLSLVAQMVGYDDWKNLSPNAYVPKWFSDSESPEHIQSLNYVDRRSLTDIRQCTYALVNSIVAIDSDDKFNFIPRRGNTGEYSIWGNLVADQSIARRYSKYCPLLVSGERSLINGCAAQALVARTCEGKITFLAVRDVLLEESEEKRRLNNIQSINGKLNNYWSTARNRKNEVSAGIYGGKNSDAPFFLSFRCFEDRIVISADLREFFSDIPNEFPLEIGFNSGVEKILLRGQEHNPVSPYIGIGSVDLINKLKQESGRKHLFVNGKNIGVLSLNGSSKALDRALQYKGCYVN